MKKSIKIAEFKSHLSAHLNEVRNGDELVIFDRKTPIAIVIPFQNTEKEDLLVIQAKKEIRHLKKLRLKTTKPPLDSLSILLEDRRSRDFLS